MKMNSAKLLALIGALLAARANEPKYVRASGGTRKSRWNETDGIHARCYGRKAVQQARAIRRRMGIA